MSYLIRLSPEQKTPLKVMEPNLLRFSRDSIEVLKLKELLQQPINRLSDVLTRTSMLPRTRKFLNLLNPILLFLRSHFQKLKLSDESFDKAAEELRSTSANPCRNT